MSGFGHFSEMGNEYMITNPIVPRPLMNYMWNARFLSGINHFGGGAGAYGNRAASYIDPDGKGRASLLRNGNRYFYVRDTGTGAYWNPGWFPVKREAEEYLCIHGPGYSKLESSVDGISCNLRIFVNDEDPVEICTLTLKNRTAQPRELQLFSFAEFSLEGYATYSEYNSYVCAEFNSEHNMIFAHNKAQERPHAWYNGFIASSAKAAGFDSSVRSFLGNYGDITAPEAVLQGRCTNSLAACEHMAGVLENRFFLNAGEEVCLHILIGIADSVETACGMVDKLFSGGKIEGDYQMLLKAKEQISRNAYIDTPDKTLNNIMNFWVKQQIQLCAEAGRATGKGFRDQLQDACAIASFNPGIARDKILETLRHEYSDGRCVRGWLPLDSHIYSDGPTWIAPAVNAYIKETGDAGLLHERVPYLDGEEGSVWEHIVTAVRYSSDDIGKHGLVLAHDGDWNDSLNGIGIGGKGESVWTSIALYAALGDAAEMAGALMNDREFSKELLMRADRIKKSVNDSGWDGEWYLAGYNDRGEKVGSHAEKEGRIYLNSQIWAILAGVADDERTKKCLRSVDEYLDSDYGPLTLVPPYTAYNGGIGRLTGFVPGIWENGTPYCHGGAFKVVADCVLGRGDAAYESLKKIMPDSALNPSDSSGCEPYVFTNMYFGPDNPRSGQTDFAWVTGTAGWMYRAVTQYMFGFHPGYNSVTINPCLPAHWDECTLKRGFRGDTYIIKIKNAGGKNPTVCMDGQALQGNTFDIAGDGREHTITVEMI